MTSSLVGSEMCIRDRLGGWWRQQQEAVPAVPSTTTRGALAVVRVKPVSYTHLTLPTICSV
eukprot:6542890-Prorocentrum_lima.AAC.1